MDKRSGTGEDRERRDELLELIVDSASDFAIYTTDDTGRATSWNIGAERLFGFTEGEVVGHSGDVIFTPEDRGAGVPGEERSRASADGRAVDERWHQRKDGSRFWASGLLMPLRSGDGYVKIARDRTEQHEAELRVRAQEERFHLLATSVPQLVFTTFADGDRTWPSPQWVDYTGLGFDKSLGQGWLEAIHPDDRELTRAGWIDAINTGEYYIEHRVWRAVDGEYRWHQTRARPLAGPTGPAEWIGTMTDIHDLRTLTDRQVVLLAELQHRTRNLLGVVQALAQQTIKKSASLEAFRDGFEERLRALSRVQSMLAELDFGDVSLRALIEAELVAHGDGATHTDKIQTHGPDVVLAPTAAQALALGIHELATNAMKYGALAQPSGKLTVNWSLARQGRHDVAIIDWRESGVSMPEREPGARKGYGTELITKALPYQLKAKTELTYGPDGVRCTIAVPVKEAAHGE
ncbi:MAG TPA: PAS domain S-box protein [Propionibacteriaceae bacterium]